MDPPLQRGQVWKYIFTQIRPRERTQLLNAPWWLATFTSLVLAFVAIYQEHIRRQLFGPRLELWFDQSSLIDVHRTVTMTTYDVADGGQRRGFIPSYWLRLRIANAGQTSASGVRVIVQALWHRAASGHYVRDARFTPLALKWSYLARPTLDTLPAGIEQHCDLLEIRDPSRAFPSGVPIESIEPCSAILQLEVNPLTAPGLLRAGSYRLQLAVAAANSDPRRFLLHFDVPVAWIDDEATMREAMHIGGVATRSPLAPLLPDSFTYE